METGGNSRSLGLDYTLGGEPNMVWRFEKFAAGRFTGMERRRSSLT